MQEEIGGRIPNLNSGGCGVFVYCCAVLCDAYRLPYRILWSEEESHFAIQLGDSWTFDGYFMVDHPDSKDFALDTLREEVNDESMWNTRFDRAYSIQLAYIVKKHFENQFGHQLYHL